jgi:hypothetical protein
VNQTNRHMPENRREQNGRASSARKLEKIVGGGISVDKIERGFGRVRGPPGYVVVGTIIVVQVVSDYGPFAPDGPAGALWTCTRMGWWYFDANREGK